MARILLSTLNAKYIHSSLALRYLKAYAEKYSSLDIAIQEHSINEPLSQVIASIYRNQPNILCFSCYIWNIQGILAILADYKKVAPYTITILGGPEVSYGAQQILRENPAVDFIVRGEGEVTFKELLQALQDDTPVQNVRGITYRVDGEIRSNPDRDLISDLDQIPFPYRGDLSQMEDKIVYYESSRGCPFKCSFCLSSVSSGVRFFSLERVKKDLAFLLRHRVREIKFVDRTFNCNEKRAMEIMEFIVENYQGGRFHCEIDAAILSPSMLEFLAAVPPDIFNFEIGIQSTFPPALQAVNRAFNWEKIERNIKVLRSFNNIHLHLDLIAGLPYEGYRDFSHSFNMAYQLNPHYLQLGFLKLLKGTLIREEANQQGYIFQENPPYQVMANNYITFREFLTLEGIEELLSRYYNSARMKTALNYIIPKLYSGNAFLFYEELAAYWQKQQLFGLGHKPGMLYSFLHNFIKEQHDYCQDVLNDLLKFDYLTNHHNSQLPQGLIGHNPSDINDRLYDLLKNQAWVDRNLNPAAYKSPREMRKHLHMEIFHWDPRTAQKGEQAIPIIFVYDPIKKVAAQTIYAENS